MKLLARFRVELGLLAATVGGSFLVWLPFWGEMGVVYRNWDAPNYLTIARTLYRVEPTNPLLAYVYEPGFYFSHLPVYPLLVRLFSFLGWQHALLFVSVSMGAVASILFYRLARDVWHLPSPGWLAFVFLFLPPRWLLVRSLGATESTYLVLLLASLLFFERGRTAPAALLAGLAAATRLPGAMLGPAYLVLLVQKKRWRELPWLLLVAAPLIAYFVFSWSRTGNPFEFVARHSAKTETLAPFAFVKHFFELGLYHQVEFFILIGLVYAVGVARIRNLEIPFAYSFFTYLFLLFMSSEEWSRFFLVIAPTALVVGYHEILSARYFKWLFGGYLAIAYVYCWGTLPLNACRPDIYFYLLQHLKIFHEWVR